MFKIQVQDDNSDPEHWHDVKSSDGTLLTFESDGEARAHMESLYPTLVKMERYAADRKRTRVLNIIEDEDDWALKSK